MVKVKDSSPLWSDSERQMITADGNVRRYVTSNVVDEFNLYDCADLSFPNGYNKGSRVFCEMAPCLTITTIKSLVVKVER